MTGRRALPKLFAMAIAAAALAVPLAALPAPAVTATAETIRINIANAPGWKPDTTYRTGDRVIAGPGYSPAPGDCTASKGSCINGAPIYLWALTGGSGGKSAAAGDGPRSCARPAGRGGIPLGKWRGATAADDNGLVWTCLTPVDYVTLTDAFSDTTLTWAANKAGSCSAPGPGCYRLFAYATNAGNVYFQTANNKVAPFTCISASSGRGPSGTAGPIADGTCRWIYQGPMVYSSRANIWPHQVFTAGSTGPATMQYPVTTNYTITVWYGGAQVPQYKAGENGESPAPTMQMHSEFFPGDTHFYCYPGTPDVSGSRYWDEQCGPGNSLKHSVVLFAVAPGDSLFDNINAAQGPLLLIRQIQPHRLGRQRNYRNARPVQIDRNSPGRVRPRLLPTR
jgi:hypothetical protein